MPLQGHLLSWLWHMASAVTSLSVCRYAPIRLPLRLYLFGWIDDFADQGGIKDIGADLKLLQDLAKRREVEAKENKKAEENRKKFTALADAAKKKVRAFS